VARHTNQHRNRNADGTIRLEGHRITLGGLVLLAVLAAIPNGFFWFSVLPDAIRTWQSGYIFGGVIQAGILIILGIITIVFTALFLFAALDLFYPKLQMNASADALKPGDQLDLRWELRRSRTPPTSLRFRLSGTEESRSYRRDEFSRPGSRNNKSKLRRFLKHDLIEITDPARIMAGRVSVTIPPGLVPTLESPHSELKYELEVIGEIPRWPNMKERYDIRILPWGDAAGGRNVKGGT
jgi:hypothetical protein